MEVRMLRTDDVLDGEGQAVGQWYHRCPHVWNVWNRMKLEGVGRWECEG